VLSPEILELPVKTLSFLLNFKPVISCPAWVISLPLPPLRGPLLDFPAIYFCSAVGGEGHCTGWLCDLDQGHVA
jgi:hypothetical protein